MSVIHTVKAFTARKFKIKGVQPFICNNHVFTLVFADRTRETTGDYWDTANQVPGGWVEDLHSPDLLGIVGHPSSLKHPKFGVTVPRPDGRGASYGSEETLEDAIHEVRMVHAELVSDHARREVDPTYALECELRGHDWYYCMSDDGTVYRGGEAHYQQIVGLIEQVMPETVKTLWAKYAPKDFTCPV
jgi:hypothetical protein